MKVAVDPSIFRDYDIRGIYPNQLNEKTFYLLGRAFSCFFNAEKIAVACDMRLSSPSLFTAITTGITDQGTDVVDLGQISTEMHYFASGKYDFPASLIVTASHNPAQYNGLKVVTCGAAPLYLGNGMEEVRALVVNQKFSTPKRKGVVRKISILNHWIKHVLKFVDISSLRPLSIVVDAGNGMGGVSWREIAGKLPVKIIPLYFEPDGRFPHHLPDPIKKENLVYVQKEILKNRSDLGFALDGDADRLFVLDENGKVVSGTILTALLAQTLLGKWGTSNILYNAVCGRIVPETVKLSGGNPIRVRVGHSFIKEAMRKYNALFAGEHSGHFYFRENFYAESSLIAGLILLESISAGNKPLSEIVNKLDKYPSSGEINYKVKDVDKILEIVENKFSDAESIDKVDGLSVWFSDWWFNLRSSKTEPLLRLNLEADDKEILNKKLKTVEYLIIRNGGIKV